MLPLFAAAMILHLGLARSEEELKNAKYASINGSQRNIHALSLVYRNLYPPLADPIPFSYSSILHLISSKDQQLRNLADRPRTFAVFWSDHPLSISGRWENRGVGAMSPSHLSTIPSMPPARVSALLTVAIAIGIA